MRVRTSRELGALVRETRRSLGLTQATTATRAGVQRSWLARLERGGENPTLAKLFAVFEVLGLELDVRPATRRTSTTRTKARTEPLPAVMVSRSARASARSSDPDVPEPSRSVGEALLDRALRRSSSDEPRRWP